MPERRHPIEKFDPNHYSFGDILRRGREREEYRDEMDRWVTKVLELLSFSPLLHEKFKSAMHEVMSEEFHKEKFLSALRTSDAAIEAGISDLRYQVEAESSQSKKERAASVEEKQRSERAHRVSVRGQWISAGAFIISTAAFLLSLPHCESKRRAALRVEIESVLSEKQKGTPSAALTPRPVSTPRTPPQLSLPTQPANTTPKKEM